MGDPITTAALMALAGGGIQYASQRSAMKQQDRELVRRLRTQEANQRTADAGVRDLVTKQSASNPNAEIDNSRAMFMKQLQANSGNANSGISNVGGASDAYKDSAQAAALGIADYGADRADTVAKITGPGMQREREARDRAQFASQLAQIMRNAQGDDFLSELRLNRIQPNPLMMMLGQGLSSFGAAGGKLGGFGNIFGGSGSDNLIKVGGQIGSKGMGKW